MIEGAYQTLAKDLPLPPNVAGATPICTYYPVLHREDRLSIYINTQMVTAFLDRVVCNSDMSLSVTIRCLRSWTGVEGVDVFSFCDAASLDFCVELSHFFRLQHVPRCVRTTEGLQEGEGLRLHEFYCAS